ncbi:MAG: hypothetical protein K2M34_01810 [Alphaproteobacteria bacterium]|nr:hypothetical protein [Alphaproteobacteria bacterium]
MRNNHNPYNMDNVDKNYIEHDNIYIAGTINYTERYRLLNAIAEMVSSKVTMAHRLRESKYFTMPVIHINIACDDQKAYISQTERFFRILAYARENGLSIETNVVDPVCMNSWLGRIIRQFATPGFRNMFESAYYYYYPETYNPLTKRTELSPTPIIITPDELLRTGLCDTIFLNNGKIRTR